MASIVSELLPLDPLGRHRLKLAFVGTHGVGKTTLCFDLALNLEPTMTADAKIQVYQRECNWMQALEGDIDTGHTVFLHLGGVDPDEAPPGSWAQYALSKRAPTYEVARRCPLPINEETTLDAQAWILHTQIAEELEAAARYEAVICDRSVLDNYAYLVARVGRRADLDQLVASWIQGYNALFKVPILEAPSFDGMRAVSRSFQAEIDATIDRLIGEFGVNVQPLDPLDREGWVATVMESIGLPKHPPQIEMFGGAAAG